LHKELVFTAMFPRIQSPVLCCYAVLLARSNLLNVRNNPANRTASLHKRLIPLLFAWFIVFIHFYCRMMRQIQNYRHLR